MAKDLLSLIIKFCTVIFGCFLFVRFAHLINVSFFDDLFAVLTDLVSSGVSFAKSSYFIYFYLNSDHFLQFAKMLTCSVLQVCISASLKTNLFYNLYWNYVFCCYVIYQNDGFNIINLARKLSFWEIAVLIEYGEQVHCIYMQNVWVQRPVQAKMKVSLITFRVHFSDTNSFCSASVSAF